MDGDGAVALISIPLSNSVHQSHLVLNTNQTTFTPARAKSVSLTKKETSTIDLPSVKVIFRWAVAIEVGRNKQFSPHSHSQSLTLST